MIRSTCAAPSRSPAQPPAPTSPNPQVGCVLVRDGAIIGEGAHLYDNFDHAEIVALLEAGAQARTATAYVTLEPCSHHGRTGPCVDALIDAGIHRVVAATVDPNPQVSGEGINRLRAAGIEVTVGVCQLEARDLNDAFAHWIQTGRPSLRSRQPSPPTAASRPRHPGKSPARSTGSPAPKPAKKSNSCATPPMLNLPASVPSLLTTPNSPTAAASPPPQTPTRHPRHPPPHPAQLLPRPVCQPGCPRPLRHPGRIRVRRAVPEAAGIEVQRIPGDHGRLDLAAVLNLLGERGILSLLLETGSHLNAAFLAANLVDKAVLFSSKANLGEGSIPFATGGPTPTQLAQSMIARARSPIGKDTRLGGVLHDPWSNLSK